MKLFEVADRYCKESTWKTMAALKFCLFSMGIIVGVLLPESCKIPVLVIFGIVFIVTYIPLMSKYFKLWKS
ncbi:MAG: permease of phosphate ABC transporter [Candidatus Ventricola sp.]